jgi:hypothetical protein
MRTVSNWSSPWRRVAATGALLGVLLLVLGRFARLIGMPEGFGPAQSLRAADLAARDDWSELRRGATLDIALFVPAYVASGFGVASLVTSSKPQRALVLAPLGLGALADLVETWLFRRSLGRLIDGATADDIEALANATRAATAVKYGGILVSAIGLVAIAARGRPRPRTTG